MCKEKEDKNSLKKEEQIAKIQDTEKRILSREENAWVILGHKCSVMLSDILVHLIINSLNSEKKLLLTLYYVFYPAIFQWVRTKLNNSYHLAF